MMACRAPCPLPMDWFARDLQVSTPRTSEYCRSRAVQPTSNPRHPRTPAHRQYFAPLGCNFIARSPLSSISLIGTTKVSLAQPVTRRHRVLNLSPCRATTST